LDWRKVEIILVVTGDDEGQGCRSFSFRSLPSIVGGIPAIVGGISVIVGKFSLELRIAPPLSEG
jgi:hypothetical protein